MTKDELKTYFDVKNTPEGHQFYLDFWKFHFMFAMSSSFTWAYIDVDNQECRTQFLSFHRVSKVGQLCPLYNLIIGPLKVTFCVL